MSSGAGAVHRARQRARTPRGVRGGGLAHLRRTAPGLYRFEPVPKPAAPAAQYGARLSGFMPPTANTSVSRGSTARHALSAAGGSASAGNILSAVGARRERGERLGRRRHAGHAHHAEPLRLADHGRVRVRHHDQLAAGVAHARDVGRPITVPAPTRQRRRTARASRRIDSNGRGELSGTSRMRKPSSVERARDRGNLLGRDAAQHGDQRQRRRDRSASSDHGMRGQCSSARLRRRCATGRAQRHRARPAPRSRRASQAPPRSARRARRCR